MVIYEVLSGHIPFHQYANLPAAIKVVKGDRPERPQGVEGVRFEDGVWEVIERCWAVQPGNRSSAEEVLQCLEKVSGSWIPPPPLTDVPTSSTFEITTVEGMHAGDVVEAGP